MIWKIYLKEMKDSFRDQKTLLLSLLMPIITVAALTLFYEYMLMQSGKEPKEAAIGISDTVSAEDFAWLSSMKSIHWVKSNDPVARARSGEVAVGIVLEGSIIKNIEIGEPVQITLYSDPTSGKADQAVNLLMTHLKEKEDAIIAERLSKVGLDPKGLHPFILNVKNLTKNSGVSFLLLSVLFTMVIIFSVMVGSYPAGIDLFAGEKEKKSMESLLLTPVPRFKLLIAKWLTISSIGAITGLFSILLFFAITKTLTQKLAENLHFGDLLLPIIFSGAIGIIFFAAFFGVLHTLISLLSRTYKEAFNYQTPVMLFALLPLFFMIDKPPQEFQLYHFFTPFVNIFALSKEIIYGIFSPLHLLLMVFSTLFAIIIGLFLAFVMFKKERWAIG